MACGQRGVRHPRTDSRAADPREADPLRADLRRADLRRADLRGADLRALAPRGHRSGGAGRREGSGLR
ncbi:pentapeptide repeat-containing protein [Kribbella sp.]|uniref:pentapeptide repeat-containing protein n=1 Tax=Kribbella sp. TaxID=1871183 RepID=UPI0039C931D9